MIFIYALMVATLSPSAWTAGPEQFSGAWSGKGTYILNGTLSQCPEFSLTFRGTADSFEFVTGHRKCDNHEEKFDQVKMEARGGELFFYGQKVGSYTEDGHLEASYRAPEGDGRFRNWRMTLHRQGKNMMYEESRRMDGEETPMISFAGLLIGTN